MKRLDVFLLVAIFCLFFSGFVQRTGKPNNAQIEISDSAKFSQEEIEAAIKCVKAQFVDFKGCNMTRLWYDEDESDFQINGFSQFKDVSEDGSGNENVIILLSDFETDSSAGESGFNPDSTYYSWMWIMTRDSKTDPWTMYDWGY